MNFCVYKIFRGMFRIDIRLTPPWSNYYHTLFVLHKCINTSNYYHKFIFVFTQALCMLSEPWMSELSYVYSILLLSLVDMYDLTV